METVFALKKGSDYSCLFAVAELLADKDKVDAVKDYLLEENSRSKSDIPQPGWDEKLLVFTAMEDNPLFFAMAWNWTSLVEQRLLNRQRLGGQSRQGGSLAGEADGDWIGLLAASTGNTQFGEKAVEGLGTLFIDCREKYGEFFVGLKVNADMLEERFPGLPVVAVAAACISPSAMFGKTVTVRQRILLKDSGRELVAVIRADALSKIVYSQPFSVEEFGNPAKGFKYLGEPQVTRED
jgi:hypothetical protein